MPCIFGVSKCLKNSKLKKAWQFPFKNAALCIVLSCYYSPGLIAPLGQTSAQVPQSTQALGSIEYFSPSLIAPLGHSSIHVPHATQSSLIT